MNKGEEIFNQALDSAHYNVDFKIWLKAQRSPELFRLINHPDIDVVGWLNMAFNGRRSLLDALAFLRND